MVVQDFLIRVEPTLIKYDNYSVYHPAAGDWLKNKGASLYRNEVYFNSPLLLVLIGRIT